MPDTISVSFTLSSGNPIVLTSGGANDKGGLSNLFRLDGIPLSEHNRTFSMSDIQSFAENTNWNSRKTRYYKPSISRQIFNLSWTMLPNRMDRTVDGRAGRDFLSLISNDLDIHTLVMVNMDASGLTPPTETVYNVIVKNYSEALIRRDASDLTYWWDCSIDLEVV